MFATDHAKQPGMSLDALEKLLGDLELQPKWRDRSQIAADYYDGKQYTAEMKAEMEERGQPVIINNLIAPTIDGVLGMEARTRTDWVVRADDNAGEDFAEGLNERMNEAARVGRADRANSDAYASQIKTGLGWVEVRRNSDPFSPARYLLNSVHRNEVYWDWHAKQPDLSDSRWLMRRRWLDKDVCLQAFPKHKLLIDNAIGGWTAFNEEALRVINPDLLDAFGDYDRFSFNDEEWLDSYRERVLVHVVYYRHWVKKPVIFLANGRALEFDENNQLHLVAVQSGRATIEVRNFPKMRVAWFLGPHRLDDRPSPHPHNHFPLVPFWGFREDRNGAPYGLIHRMIPSQDAVNYRESKLTWILNAKRVIMDNDATDMSHQDVLNEVARSDGQIILNPDRANRDQHAFRVETDFNIASQQFQVMMDAQKKIQDCAGVYAAYLGQDGGGATSGIAISSLVEQGAMTLSEINDNFRDAKQRVGELLLAHIIEDMKGKEVAITVNKHSSKPTKTIVFGAAIQADDGTRQISNDVSKVQAHVVLADIQSTPGYRAQLLERLLQLAAGLPPEVQSILVPMIIEASDLPEKDEIVKQVRQKLGMASDPEDMTPEQQAAMKKAQEKEALVEQFNLEEMKARLAKLQAESRKLNAAAIRDEHEASKAPAETELVQAQTMKLHQEMQAATEEMNRIITFYKDYLDAELARVGR